jgi:hypothetical protein
MASYRSVDIVEDQYEHCKTSYGQEQELKLAALAFGG